MSCDPKDVALKSIFLGPQAENALWFEHRWLEIARHWAEWRRSVFSADGSAISEADQGSALFLRQQREIETRLKELLRLLDSEVPKFTPRFLGHMTSELALPALLGHAAVLLHNPNLTSKEVSVVTSRLEEEAIADLAGMMGFQPRESRGHFSSGGTLANVESLWRALYRHDRTLALGMHSIEARQIEREDFRSHACLDWRWFEENARGIPSEALDGFSFLRLGPYRFAEAHERVTGVRYRAPWVLVPASRHFSWPKAVTMLGLGRDSLREIELDRHGRLSLKHLERALLAARAQGHPVLMAVSGAGATGSGSVDQIHRVQDLLDAHKAERGESIWHHVDAAYGGYFCSLLRGKGKGGLGREVEESLGGIARANSVTLDPHKLGYVPYSCGVILVRDERDYRCPSFDAPYLLSGNGGAWQNTIEGSRAGTGAVATWMANKTIGLDTEGYGRILARDLAGTQSLLAELVRAEEEISIFGPTDLNILCFMLARKGDALSRCNARTLACFREMQASPNFSVSKTEFSLSHHREHASANLKEKDIELNDEKVLCLRVVLMNPFFCSKETEVQYERLFADELLSVAARV